MRDLAAEVLDNLNGRDEFDFVNDIARELPMRMLGRLLGLPDEDLDWLVSRGDALIGNTDPDFTDYVVDQTDTSDVSAPALSQPGRPRALRLRRSRRSRTVASHPTHDVLTALLEPNADGETLDDLALKNFFTLMVAAGNDTTRYTMAAGMHVFIERPELFARSRR